MYYPEVTASQFPDPTALALQKFNLEVVVL
jgi:hypothetical protein